MLYLIKPMFIFLLSFFAYFFTKPAYAIDEFNIVRNIEYSIDQSGNANVNQSVELTNNLSEIYPKVDQVILPFTNIGQITGNDNSGNIVQKIEKNSTSTTINLKFNQASLGKGKTTKYQLHYSLPQLAIKKGNNWEIQLPDYKDIKDSETININLNVPENFGIISFASVTPQNSIVYNQQTHIQLSLDNHKNQKLLFIFGDYQVFDFNFKYFLKNDTDKTVIKEIAIPPETQSQKIIFNEISPQPIEIKTDPDGNWLAQYQLKPNDSFEVNVSGQAKIVSSVNQDLNVDTQKLIQSQKYWPVNDGTITEIASTLNQPKDIYNYVVNQLNYNYDQINSAQRKGVLEALNNPNDSLCTEFTDLFVTLARAKGIPSREIEGFAYTNNPKVKPINLNADILHAWPQYFDSTSQKWISIDPTWAKTTNGVDFFDGLDLNHFIFVIHGQNSEYPLPPGAYKNNQNIKTVSVSFASKEFQASYLAPTISFSKTKFGQNPEIIIHNNNPNTLNNVVISSQNQSWNRQINTINPYSSIKITLPNLNFLDSLRFNNQKISLQVNYQNSESPISFSTTYLPHFFNLSIIIALAIVILTGSGIILTKKKRHD